MIKLPGPKRTAKPDPRSVLARKAFNLQRHGFRLRGALLRMQRLGHSQFVEEVRLRIKVLPGF
jgi:hypothetical protein